MTFRNASATWRAEIDESAIYCAVRGPTIGIGMRETFAGAQIATCLPSDCGYGQNPPFPETPFTTPTAGTPRAAAT
jgi:hypothetical protein